jgi:hypothetical protein
LPTASFRFHLTMDTLAVQLVVPTTKPTADFHRQVTAHAGRTKEIKVVDHATFISLVEPIHLLLLI